MKKTIGQIGEIEFINRLKYFAPKGQINDDTAEINTQGQNILINTVLIYIVNQSFLH